MGGTFSVKNKIVLSLWATTLLILSLAGVVVSVWFSQDQSRRLDEFLSREVRGVQETLATYLLGHPSRTDDPAPLETEEFRTFLKGYFADRLNRPLPYKTTLGIFDADGRLIRASNTALSLAFADEATSEVALVTLKSPADSRLAVGGLEVKGVPVGSVRMACLTSALTEAWSGFVGILVLVLVLVFMTFGGLGTFLIGWSLRPVRSMSTSAQDISEAHLDLRLEVPGGQDELSDLARTLNSLLDRLERDFHMERTLLGQLSHELRTPLSILRGRTEVALERLGGGEPVTAAFLEDTMSDIDNITTLLNTLLGLARLDARVDPIHLDRVDLMTILNDLVEELEPLWDEKSLRVVLLAPGGGTDGTRSPRLWVVGDAVLLKQVFLNVLTNAYKYAPTASEVRIETDSVSDHGHHLWSITILNQGPPIPEESLDLVFRRFYRVESQNPDRFENDSGLGQRGYGLGLSIAKSLVELHDGTIRAFNPTRGGTAFEVCLVQSPPAEEIDLTRR